MQITTFDKWDTDDKPQSRWEHLQGIHQYLESRAPRGVADDY